MTTPSFLYSIVSIRAAMNQTNLFSFLASSKTDESDDLFGEDPPSEPEATITEQSRPHTDSEPPTLEPDPIPEPSVPIQPVTTTTTTTTTNDDDDLFGEDETETEPKSKTDTDNKVGLALKMAIWCLFAFSDG